MKRSNEADQTFYMAKGAEIYDITLGAWPGCAGQSYGIQLKLPEQTKLKERSTSQGQKFKYGIVMSIDHDGCFVRSVFLCVSVILPNYIYYFTPL
jgi:hypothetical protein